MCNLSLLAKLMVTVHYPDFTRSMSNSFCAKTRVRVLCPLYVVVHSNPAALGVVYIILTSQSGHRARHILYGALEDEDDLVVNVLRTVSHSEYSEYSEASGGRVSSTKPH